MTAKILIPDGVGRKVRALGAAGLDWLDLLPQVVADLERAWGIEVGAPIEGGSAAYVTIVTTGEGHVAVLKVAIPDGLEGQGDFGRELAAVRSGQGAGYVKLFRFDAARRAMLMERLGRRIGDLGLPIEAQIEAIAATVQQGWRRPAPGYRWRTGAEQAQFLHDFIDQHWQTLGRPCPRWVIDEARRCAAARRDAFDEPDGVLIHGDAHAWNVLEDLDPQDGSTGFKLIDPDAMLSEPAHDLAIPLRHWNEELSRGDASRRVREWCATLHDATGADADAIWQWALAERVSTGLFMLRLGHQEGRTFLAVAEAVAAG